jgi:hypothetical protein
VPIGVFDIDIEDDEPAGRAGGDTDQRIRPSDATSRQ